MWHDEKEVYPTPHVLVFIIEKFYHTKPTIGYWDGLVWRTWNGSDDCYVTHWMRITYPHFVPITRQMKRKKDGGKKW